MCMTIECPECGHGIRITRIEVAQRARPAAADWLGLETKEQMDRWQVGVDMGSGRDSTAVVRRPYKKRDLQADPECDAGCDEDCNCRG